MGWRYMTKVILPVSPRESRKESGCDASAGTPLFRSVILSEPEPRLAGVRVSRRIYAFVPLKNTQILRLRASFASLTGASLRMTIKLDRLHGLAEQLFRPVSAM